MRWTTTLTFSVAMTAMLSSCGGNDDTGKTNTNVDPCIENPALCPTGDTSTNTEPAYMEPVAVGFEIDAVIHEDGTLRPVGYEDGSSSPPFIKLIFADSDFFGLGVDQQEGHYCEIAGSLDNAYVSVLPQDSTNPVFNTKTGTVLNWSYEFNIVLDLEFTGTQCAGMVDPELYGADALGLLEPFNGAHIGFGFAPMTDYLWEQWGGSTATGNEDYTDKFFAMYVAVNDKDGHWGGCDWTSALVFEVDAADVPVADEYDQLIPLPVDTIGTGPLPKGYVRSFAYWYQDFPLMDFSNLTNPPVAGDWACE